jgi:hypothetical protein
MAQFRLSSQIIGRSAGRSAVAAAAYRAGASFADERTGQLHDYSRRRGVIHAEILAPENTPAWMLDRSRLWNAVELAEKRKDAQLAREIQLSLPHELTAEQRRDLVRRFADEQFVRKGMIADIALHSPGKEGDDRNHHAHIMLTMRELAGDGFGKKARDWNTPDVLQGWREAWAQEQNRTLEAHGHAARVDHRSLEAQGIDREPTQHLGQAANDMEQRGKPSRIGDENRAIEDRNNDRDESHRQAAALAMEIDRLKREEAAQAGARRAACEALQRVSGVEMEQRHGRQAVELEERLTREYGGHRKALGDAASSIESRLQATGFRRVLRDITGRSAADRERLKAIKETRAEIDQHERAERAALHQQQEQERRSRQAAHQAQLERVASATAAAFEQQRQEAIRAAKAAPATSAEADKAKAVRLAVKLAAAARAQASKEPVAKDFTKAGRPTAEQPAPEKRKPRGHDHDR